VLVLSADEVASLLDLDSLADALQAAMADLSAGRASVPPRAAALAPPPAGAVELLRAIELHVIRASQIVEVGEVAAGTARGRTSGTQLTLYKSVGVAAQDAVAAALVLAAASERRTGTHISM
jgi:alanine dehydrogenase